MPPPHVSIQMLDQLNDGKSSSKDDQIGTDEGESNDEEESEDDED